jgi:hypothetical protein
MRDGGNGFVAIESEQTAGHEGLPFLPEAIIKSAAHPLNDADVSRT